MLFSPQAVQRSRARLYRLSVRGIHNSTPIALDNRAQRQFEGHATTASVTSPKVQHMAIPRLCPFPAAGWATTGTLTWKSGNIHAVQVSLVARIIWMGNKRYARRKQFRGGWSQYRAVPVFAAESYLMVKPSYSRLSSSPGQLPSGMWHPTDRGPPADTLPPRARLCGKRAGPRAADVRQSCGMSATSQQIGQRVLHRFSNSFSSFAVSFSHNSIKFRRRTGTWSLAWIFCLQCLQRGLEIGIVLEGSIYAHTVIVLDTPFCREAVVIPSIG